MSAVLGVVKDGLRRRSGEITADQLIYAVGRRTAKADAAGAAVAGLATPAMSAFPALAPILAWRRVLPLVYLARRLAAAAAGWYGELGGGTAAWTAAQA